MQRLAALVVVATLFLPGSRASGQALSHAYGRSLAEWMQLYFRWVLDDGDEQVGPVRFMPIPQGTPVAGSGTYDDPQISVGQLDVTFQPNQAFMLPVAVVYGETYDPDLGMPDDTSVARSVFTRTNAFVELDGQRIIDVHNLKKFYVAPTYFDPPIFYDQETDYGAIGAIFVQGLGFVHRPLSEGTHRMRLYSEIRIPDQDIGAIYYNEWTITVAP